MSEFEKLMRECYEQSYGEKWDESNPHHLEQSVWATAWDASRAALVVELPEPSDSPYGWQYKGDYAQQDFDRDEARYDAQVAMLQDCREALTKAGVTVK